MSGMVERLAAKWGAYKEDNRFGIKNTHLDPDVSDAHWWLTAIAQELTDRHDADMASSDPVAWGFDNAAYLLRSEAKS